MITRDSVWWVKWISTVGAIGCAASVSLEIYPLNVWLGFLAGLGWTWVGYVWREWAIVNLNGFLSLLYGAGAVRSMLI